MAGDHLRIGPFRIIRELGRGAFAVVYLAHDDGLQRDVAIKVLTSVREQTDVQRFLDEGVQMAQLRDAQHVVAVYQHGVHEGAPFLVMEYMSGGTVEQYRGCGDPGATRALIEDSLSGLATIHEAGVIHRDIKPHNLLLTTEGRVKVGDLGLAKVLRPQRPSVLTTPGTAPGTARYMAPEQLNPALGEVGAAADVYAIGMVAHELITGRLPFDDVEAPLQQRAQQEPPVLRGGCDCDDVDLVDWIDWTIRLRPDDRPPDAAAALAALRNRVGPAVTHPGVYRAAALAMLLLVSAVALLTRTYWLLPLAVVGAGCLAALPLVKARL